MELFLFKIKDWIKEKVSKKYLWRVKARVLISLQDWGGIKFNEEENLSKCLDQILLSIKLKEKWSLGTEVNENKKDEEKVKLILINK